MNQRATQPASAAARWPMTSHAHAALIDEIDRLRDDVEAEAGRAIDGDGVIHLPVAKAARRLEVLSAVLEAVELVDAPDLAVIGRRVTIQEQDGESDTYSLVFPGDGDPPQGWISADAPLGAAILGHGGGDTVEVVAPAGRRTVTLVRVE